MPQLQRNKGITFYENDDEFNLVLLHQPRQQSDPIPVESMSVGSAVDPVQLPPVIVVVSVLMDSWNEIYIIGHNTHVSERVLRILSEQWNLPETATAQ